MADVQQHTCTGTRGTIAVREWPNADARYLAVLVHGYGEHIGRYEHVAEALLRNGATVCGPDHLGHGQSDGERVSITDFEDVVSDVHTVVEAARAEHPGLPTVVIGHSMGGMIATRYAQRYGDRLAALVLSGPVIGRWDLIDMLLAADEIPDLPIDPATLSRDPAVGEAYAADPLVWHGNFKRETVQAIADTMHTINDSGTLGPLPTLWIHGEDDKIVPMPASRTGIEQIRGTDLTAISYPGAQHEVFNETNRAEVLDRVTTFIDGAVGRR